MTDLPEPATKTNLDDDGDDVLPARAELAGLVDKFNQLLDYLAEDSGGQWQDLKVVDISSPAASVTFIHGADGVVIDNTYDKYRIEYIDVTVEDDGDPIIVRSTPDGLTFDSTSGQYAWAFDGHDSGVGNIGDQNGSHNRIEISSAIGNAASESFCGEVEIFNPAGTLRHKKFDFRGCHDDTGGDVRTLRGGGKRLSTAAIVGFETKPASSDFTGGRIIFSGRKVNP